MSASLHGRRKESRRAPVPGQGKEALLLISSVVTPSSGIKPALATRVRKSCALELPMVSLAIYLRFALSALNRLQGARGIHPRLAHLFQGLPSSCVLENVIYPLCAVAERLLWAGKKRTDQSSEPASALRFLSCQKAVCVDLT